MSTIYKNNFLFVFLLLTVSFLLNTYSQEPDNYKRGIRTIYLIRHGEYNSDDERDPDVGKELVPLGIAQTKLLSARLKSMRVKFSSLTSSTMTRARQTAIIINEELPELNLQLSQQIRECTPPTWRHDIMEEKDSTDLIECVENLENAFQKYFIPSPDELDRNDIIVCHGNVIRYFVTKVLKVESKSWLQMTIGNCSLTIVKIKSDSSMKLVSFSDMGHIPPNLQTVTGGENEIKKLVLPE